MVNPRYFYRGFFIVLPQNSEDRWSFQFSLALVNVLHMGAKLNLLYSSHLHLQKKCG